MPAFVSMVAMPYTFSIGYGIIGGLLLWTLGMISLCHVDVHYNKNPLKLQRMSQMPSSSCFSKSESTAVYLEKCEFHPFPES